MCVLSHVRLFAPPWTVTCQAPLSTGFPRQEYWSGLPLPSSGTLPDLGIKPISLGFPALAGRFFTTEPPGKPFTTESPGRPTKYNPADQIQFTAFFCKQGFVEIHNTMAELNSCDRDSMAHRAEKIYSLTFDRKNHPSFARQSPAFSP